MTFTASLNWKIFPFAEEKASDFYRTLAFLKLTGFNSSSLLLDQTYRQSHWYLLVLTNCAILVTEIYNGIRWSYLAFGIPASSSSVFWTVGCWRWRTSGSHFLHTFMHFHFALESFVAGFGLWAAVFILHFAFHLKNTSVFVSFVINQSIIYFNIMTAIIFRKGEKN